MRIRQTYKFLIYINEKGGGRSRARTYDPLIKSEKFALVAAFREISEVKRKSASTKFTVLITVLKPVSRTVRYNNHLKIMVPARGFEPLAP